MNALVNTNVQTMSHREIASLTGKEGRHVKRDCEVMFAELELDPNGYAQNWTHPQNGRTYIEYMLPKDLVETLITGYSIKLRHAVLLRLRELEEAIKGDLIALPNFADPVEAARAWANEVEAKRLACKERDHAIETKAHISDKKTATAMATASVKSRQAEKLKEQIGESRNYASVKAVEKLAGGKYNWRELKKWCLAHGKKIKDIADANYGSVKIYHKDAWKAVYGINLTDYFAT
ncbi:Rha family transcriptional regulator [Acinetobacter baumannii]